eukprot:scpid28552/ scgid24396/ Craniofacial development protein 2; p97 bucentaur protein
MVTSDMTTRADPRPPERGGVANPRSELSSQHAPAARRFVLSLGTWNVRTLVESDGDVNTASKFQKKSKHLLREEKKIDLVCRQLGRFGVDIAGLQETLWFGTAQYSVGDSLVLASGRPTPTADDSGRRGEGVAIVLRGKCKDAFVSGGSEWKGHSSRLVSAKVKFECGRNRSVSCIHIAVAYAPTFSRSREEKAAFYESLQSFLDSVPRSDQYVILGDFNARVGVGTAGDEWSRVRGTHGHGVMNSAGEDLLNFLARNSALICNTWFKKKDIHKHTWHHPRYGQPHCIDYCIIPESCQRQCLDCQVLRSAECDTDHKFLAMRYRLAAVPSFRRQSKPANKPIASAVLTAPSNDEVRAKYSTSLDAALVQNWPDELSVDGCWAALKTTVADVAQKCLGRERRKQPDWFLDNRPKIEAALRERDDCYRAWMSTNRASDQKLYKKARSSARRIVRQAKQDWLRKQARDCERFSLTSKGGWECIKRIQTALDGLQPRKTAAIKNAQGVVCETPEATGTRWREHFDGVLNVISDFVPDAIDSIGQLPIRLDLENAPACSEIHRAMRALQNGKACGRSEITAEMLKCGSELVPRLEMLLAEVWRTERVPQDWADAILIPIPKKGDLSECDNWRGIALLDVVGKLVARIIADRLQLVGEEYLPDSQCGFRRGRGMLRHGVLSTPGCREIA